MARSKQQTYKNKADKLYSLIIRSRGFCERCGQTPPTVRLETSHFNSRRYSWTRTDLSNSACLCSACHRYVGANPSDHADFFLDLVGVDEFERINSRKHRREKFDWESEYQRLLEIWDDGEWQGVRCGGCMRLRPASEISDETGLGGCCE